MKRYILPSLGGITLIAAGVLLAPLSASADGYVPNDPCTHTVCSTSTKVVPDSNPSNAALADTGSSIPVGLLAAGGAAVVLGVSIVVVRRRSRTSA